MNEEAHRGKTSVYLNDQRLERVKNSGKSLLELIDAGLDAGKPKCQTCGKPAIIRLNNEDMCADCHADYWASQGVGTQPGRLRDPNNMTGHEVFEDIADERRARMTSPEVPEVPEEIHEVARELGMSTAHVDEPIVPHFFRSCPACRGSGKLDLRCVVCEGRGSVTTDPEGNPAPAVADAAKRLLEAAHVAILPTAEYERMRANHQREVMEWGVRWLRSRAKNLAATQDYLGEHRLNQAADLLQKDFEEWVDGS